MTAGKLIGPKPLGNSGSVVSHDPQWDVVRPHIDRAENTLENVETSVAPAKVYGNGALPACMDEEVRPRSAAELIDDLPSDIILRSENKMRTGGEDAVNGHPIMPLPPEFLWMNRAPNRSDVTYTFILEVVHRELKRFAARIDKYFVLTPREDDDANQKEET